MSKKTRVKKVAKEFGGFLAVGGITFYVFLIPVSGVAILEESLTPIIIGWIGMGFAIASLAFGLWGYVLDNSKVRDE